MRIDFCRMKTGSQAPVLSHRGHFQFGYDGNFGQILRRHNQQKFTARYGPVEALLPGWREANELAARQIYQRFGRRTTICFSGGCDSEITLRSFIDQGLDVRVATLKFAGGLNSHDTVWADRFLSQRGISADVYELDPQLYWQSQEFIDLARMVRCVSPQLLCHLWLCDQILENEGAPVIGQGEPYLRKTTSQDYQPGISPYLPSPWVYVESERLCSLFRFFYLRQAEGVPGFFQYLPEQTETFLRCSSYLRRLMNNEIEGKLSTRTSKFQLLKEFYPDLRERPKFHGFEKIEEESDRLRQVLANMFPDSDQDFDFEFEEIMEQLNGG